MSEHGLIPREFNVVVKPDDLEVKTPGGIIIPDEKRDRDQNAVMTGVLIASADFAFSEIGDPIADGTRVIFARYAGSEVEGKDGESYRVIKDKDILCEVAA